MKLTVIAAMAAAVVGAAAQAQAQDACPKADASQAGPTVERFLAALGGVDEPALRGLLAPDFYAFDSGRRFDGMALPQMIAGLKAGGTTVKLSMSEAAVHASCGTAWVTYLNKGALTSSAGVKNLSWLESVVLAWDGGAWRVKFMHATEVAAK